MSVFVTVNHQNFNCKFTPKFLNITVKISVLKKVKNEIKAHI